MENKKLIGKHILKYRKYWDVDKEMIFVDVEVNHRLKSLLNEFKANLTANRSNTTTLINNQQRYLIKAIVVNGGYFYSIFNYLWEKKLVDSGKTTLKFASKNDYNELIGKLPRFQELVREMEQIRANEDYRAEITISR